MSLMAPECDGHRSLLFTDMTALLMKMIPYRQQSSLQLGNVGWR